MRGNESAVCMYMTQEPRAAEFVLDALAQAGIQRPYFFLCPRVQWGSWLPHVETALYR
jgi:hypothetical protein